MQRLLVATGFVGGYGGTAKIRRALKCLADMDIHPIIATESGYVENLGKFGIIPDVTISQGANPTETYNKVKAGLRGVKYDMMVSFGPRTYWPMDAVEKGRKAVIVDGGLPPFIGDPDTDHSRQVYVGLGGYFLTCHFPWDIPNEVRSVYDGMPIEVLSQPISFDLNEHLKELRLIDQDEISVKRDRFLRRNFGLEYGGELFVSIRMSHALFDESSLEDNGGWLSREKFLQCDKFMSDLLYGLGESGERIVVHVSPLISSGYEHIIDKYPNIVVVGKAFLPPGDCIELSRIADINIDRAIRCVTEAEVAITGGFSVISPCPTGYMHEDIATGAAEQMGLVRAIPIDTPDIGEVILDYIGSDHYHSSRNLRMRTWDRMFGDRNIMDRIDQVYQSEPRA